jgi:acetoin utilization deacetylase AcuC-like enzyme
MKILQDTSRFSEYEVAISSHFEKASVELLQRVHSSEYIAFVDKLSRQLQSSEGSRLLPFTPQVQKSILHQPSTNLKSAENCDTSFSAGTLQAARRAAGAVAHAVDLVLLGRNRNAFCAIRPPGHHAGYEGLLSNARSCGFCIFNNVAVGALHALEDHNCERVAIIDVDIHHGNIFLKNMK